MSESLANTPKWRLWLHAARPKTLAAGVIPVCVGLAIATLSVRLNISVALATLVCTICLQVTTNLANDYYDFLSGVDDDDRLGPLRLTQAGLLRPEAVRTAMFLALVAAIALGFYLVAVGGVPILAIGLVSALTAVAYSRSFGPVPPLASIGLGDALAFIFFGLVAVTGTVYLQTREFSSPALLGALPVACLATALIVVNNLRDMASDHRAGKRTVAVRIGERATRMEYCLLLAGAYVFALVFAARFSPAAALVLLSLPLAFREARAFMSRDGKALNESLGGTARLETIFGLLFVVGIVL